MTNQEAIDRWATYIVPAVFKAEVNLQAKHPEWKERLSNIKPDEGPELANEYCRAIAEEIVLNAADADIEEEKEVPDGHKD